MFGIGLAVVQQRQGTEVSLESQVVADASSSRLAAQQANLDHPRMRANETGRVEEYDKMERLHFSFFLKK